jgi:hypothetical protein
MTCAPVKSLLEPYLDEELDAVQRAQVAEHLAACGSCAEMHARLLELRTAIRAHAPYYRAPASLPQRIRFSLRQANRPAAGPWRRIAIAAAILLSASAAWNVALFRWHTSHADLIAQNVLSSHGLGINLGLDIGAISLKLAALGKTGGPRDPGTPLRGPVPVPPDGAPGDAAGAVGLPPHRRQPHSIHLRPAAEFYERCPKRAWKASASPAPAAAPSPRCWGCSSKTNSRPSPA